MVRQPTYHAGVQRGLYDAERLSRLRVRVFFDCCMAGQFDLESISRHRTCCNDCGNGRISVKNQAVEEESMTLTPAALQQLITSLDEKHDDAHLRLRTELAYVKNQLDSGLQAVRAEIALVRTEMATHVAMPIDVTKLVLTPKIVFTIVLIVVSIYGTIWASTYGLGSDVRDILTRIDSQKAALESAVKLQELRSDTVKGAIDDVKRRQETQATELQSMKEAIARLAR